jgi:hypothetical protein
MSSASKNLAMTATAQTVEALCPVCAYTLAVPFFNGGLQPLATLGWPRSAAEARGMPRHAHDFVQCPSCSHVWNRSFHYDAIPYKHNPNRMFNRGGVWQGHLAMTRNLVLARLPAEPTVIEIGCGEGHFLRGLAQARQNRGRFIGFDPNASPETGIGVEFHGRLFEPLADTPAFAPDAVVIRHVLEHLVDPCALLDRLAWASAHAGKSCLLFAEMPCIDRVFATGRIVDFFYEHVAHFTSQSFRTLMNRAGTVLELDKGYDGEVVYALVALGIPDGTRARAAAAASFSERSERSRTAIRAQLDALASSGQKLAIWGGTGKAAAFIHQFCADATRFPLVVESDRDKVGSFVPGTGQEIQFRDALLSKPVDVIVIPTQWRAKDIVTEMQRTGIDAGKILIEHDGRLIDYRRDPHPYG